LKRDGTGTRSTCGKAGRVVGCRGSSPTWGTRGAISGCPLPPWGRRAFRAVPLGFRAAAAAVRPAVVGGEVLSTAASRCWQGAAAVLGRASTGGAWLRKGEASFGLFFEESNNHMPAQRHQTHSAPHGVVAPPAKPLNAPLISGYRLLGTVVSGTWRVSLHVFVRRAPGHLHLVVVLLADKMHHLARYRAHAADVHSQCTAVIGQ